MTDEKESTNRPSGMNKDEIALELTRFIATTTGLGKSATGTGFAGKAPAKSAEEQVEALLQLYDKCRESVGRHS